MKSSLLRHEIILRIGALLMILALVFSFSACGSNEQGSADEDQAAQTEENTETAEETKSESKGPAFEPKTVQKQKSQINVLTGELGSKKNKIKTRVVGIVFVNQPHNAHCNSKRHNYHRSYDFYGGFLRAAYHRFLKFGNVVG